MTEIDWKGMPHGMLTAELQRGLEERDDRIAQLSAIGTPREPQPLPVRRGRPPTKNGSEFSERGLLDAEVTQ